MPQLPTLREKWRWAVNRTDWSTFLWSLFGAPVGGLVSVILGLADAVKVAGAAVVSVLVVFVAQLMVKFIRAPAGILLERLGAVERERDLAGAEVHRLAISIQAPSLKGLISSTNIGQTSDGGVSFVVLITLENQGQMPTITKNWRMTVTLPDGRIFVPRLTHLPPEGLTLRSESGIEKHYTPSQAIYERTASVPIAFGAAVPGILFGVVPDEQHATFTHALTIEVVCSDIIGKELVLRHEITEQGMGKDLRYIPGL